MRWRACSTNAAAGCIALTPSIKWPRPVRNDWSPPQSLRPVACSAAASSSASFNCAIDMDLPRYSNVRLRLFGMPAVVLRRARCDLCLAASQIDTWTIGRYVPVQLGQFHQFATLDEALAAVRTGKALPAQVEPALVQTARIDPVVHARIEQGNHIGRRAVGIERALR